MQNDNLQKYLNEVNASEKLSDEEILEHSKGDLDVAKSMLVESNLKLVTYIAKQYHAAANNLDDLIGEGNCGLMQAAERFDFNKGVKFSTFASFYIKSKMREFIYKKNKPIAIPLGAVNKYFKIHRAEEEFKELHGREPTIEELSNKIGVAQTQIINLKNTMGMADSLERKVADDSGEGTELGHLIPDESSDFVSRIETAEGIDNLLKSLSQLGEREQYVINARFGLSGEKIKTLDQIGGHLNLTKERVRQIQETTISKLKLMLSTNNEMGLSKSSLVNKETASRKESKRIGVKYKCPPKRISKSKTQEQYWESLGGERFSPTSI